MRKFLQFGLFSLSTALFATTINVGTSTVWTVSGPSVVGTIAASSLGSAPNSVWLPSPVTSTWIGSTSTDGNISSTQLAGTYVYSYTLNTAALGGSLNYITAADDKDTVRVFLDNVLINTYNHLGNALNGGAGCAFLPTGATNCSGGVGFGEIGPGAISWGAGGAGVIKIQGTVVNATNGPTGFLVTGSATYADPVSPTPEPTTFAMLGLGGLAILGSRRFRKG